MPAYTIELERRTRETFLIVAPTANDAEAKAMETAEIMRGNIFADALEVLSITAEPQVQTSYLHPAAVVLL